MSSLVSAKGPSVMVGLPAGEGDALAFGAGLEAFAGQHHACFDQFFVELAHVGEEFGAGEDACF